jgi:uncharacterized protein YigE (DUF2233 family)
MTSLLALVLLAAPAGDTTLWQPVAPGIERLEITGQLLAFRFDLARYRAEVVVPGAEAPRTAAELRQQHGAVLAVNGGFFDERGRPLGLRISRGRSLKALRPVDWGVLVLSEGEARIVHTREYATHVVGKTVQDALQVGPRVLVAGQVPALRPQRSRRTAVAVPADGRSLTVALADRSMSAETMGQLLQGLGFRDALLLDGGPSTQLSFALGQQRLEYPGAYPVPDGLVVRAR